MALRNIVKLGDPILNKKSRKIEKFDDKLASQACLLFARAVSGDGLKTLTPIFSNSAAVLALFVRFITKSGLEQTSKCSASTSSAPKYFLNFETANSFRFASYSE